MKKFIPEGLFFVVVGALLFMSSCVSQKKVILLQNEQMIDSVRSIEYVNKRVFDYKVQPGDNLYIRVSSMDKTFSEFFNSNTTTHTSLTGGSNTIGHPSIYLNGYTVSDAGTIDFPYAGVIYVKDLTIEEIQKKIQQVIGEYQKETIVYVKLGVFNLTIYGEVARPGQYQVYQSDINVLQAMALAGNATDYANKSNIKIVHQTTEGSQIVRVNLNDADILSNPDFYLKPNDIIYVEPLGIKRYGFTSVPYSTIFSAASLLITCLTFFMMYLK
ncbi:MAG: polysaccharide biosynthesis/export family protein [Candidatus Limimorpha sp.]